MYDYNLLNDLKAAELDFLIPSDREIDKYMSEESWGYGPDAETGEAWGYAGEDEDYDGYGEDEDGHAGNVPTLYDDGYGRDPLKDRESSITLPELASMFRLDGGEGYMEEEELYEKLLNSNVAELIGITNAQAKFINLDYLYSREIADSFFTDMQDAAVRRIIPDAQERIGFCLSRTLFIGDGDFESLVPLEDALRIVKAKGYANSAVPLRRYRDYRRMYEDCRSAFQGAKNKAMPDGDREKINRVREVFDALPDRPKPSHVKDAHDKAARIMRTLNAVLRRRDESYYDAAMAGAARGKTYRRFLTEGKEYAVVPIKSYRELVREGEALDHCVAEYVDDIILGRSLIYGIRRADDKDTPYFTAEILPQTPDGRMPFRLTQCFGEHDETDKPDSLAKFIQDWCREKGVSVRCEL